MFYFQSEFESRNIANSEEVYFKETYDFFKKNFPHIPRHKFKLLLRKGVFPYTYIKNYEVLKETKLPSRDDFYNDLIQEHISWEDYHHAKKVRFIF